MYDFDSPVAMTSAGARVTTRAREDAWNKTGGPSTAFVSPAGVHGNPTYDQLDQLSVHSHLSTTQMEHDFMAAASPIRQETHC